ncbi:hypothetical protein Tco_1455075 [Tanacetum coccineum]
MKQVQFLGYVINGDGIHVDPNKIKAVKNWKAPKTLSQGEEQERAFQTLKDKLCNAPVLALPDRPEDFMSSIKDKILAAQNEASKVVNAPAEMLRGLHEQMERRSDGALNEKGYSLTDGQSKCTIQTLEDMLRECILDFRGSWDVHLPLVEVGEGQLIGPKIVQETTEKISQIKDRLKATRDHQKSYATKRMKPLEFSEGDHVLLKVSPWKGVVRFRKKGELAPRYVGPFEIIERIGPVAYRLRLPQELNNVHDMFHVSNLKKCLADPTLHVPLEEIQVDA